MKKTTVISCGLLALLIIYILLHSLVITAKERDVARAIVGQLSMAYEQHLFVEYGKTICGVEPQILKGVTTFNIPGEKDSACMAGIREKAEDEVAKLKQIKK